MARPWSANELRFATMQRADGKSLKEIARKLRRNEKGVEAKLRYEAVKKSAQAKKVKQHYPENIWSNADDLAAARAHLRVEIAAARAEWRTAPLYKPAVS